MQEKKEHDFNGFMDIIRELRGEHGCPWDKEQTHESLKTPMIEECYEAIEAINNKDMDNLREELGDILLQVALNAVIAEENNEFTINDVVEEVSKKMIRRHPHVFSDETLETAEDVIVKWEDIKKEEKNESSELEGILRVPKALPANIRAQKVLKKANKAGIGISSYDEVIIKLKEIINELEEARQTGSSEQIEVKYESLMFTIVNLSIFLGLNAENSLTNATDKFINNL
jgi:tetrapyrrole methylase family protein/MazG family protein